MQLTHKAQLRTGDRPAAVRHIGEAATGGSACCHWPDARALDADILMERSTKKDGISIRRS